VHHPGSPEVRHKLDFGVFQVLFVNDVALTILDLPGSIEDPRGEPAYEIPFGVQFRDGMQAVSP